MVGKSSSWCKDYLTRNIWLSNWIAVGLLNGSLFKQQIIKFFKWFDKCSGTSGIWFYNPILRIAVTWLSNL